MTTTNTATHTDAIAHQLQVLTNAVLTLVSHTGHRLSRDDLCTRLGVHRNTVANRLKTDRTFPRPGPDGKWSLADVVAWELKNGAAK